MLTVVRMLPQQRPASSISSAVCRCERPVPPSLDRDGAAHETDVEQPGYDLHRELPVPLGRRDQRRDLVQVRPGAPGQPGAAGVERGPVPRSGRPRRAPLPGDRRGRRPAVN